MANENNNINELVADDDDPTVELRTPTFSSGGDDQLEVDAKTFDTLNFVAADATDGDVDVSKLKSDLISRQESIGRLQFDIEQLHAKWLGVEAEAEARQEQTIQLNDDLNLLRETVVRKERLIKKRDGKIKALKSEIRQRDEAFRELKYQLDDLQLIYAKVPASSNESSGATSTSSSNDAIELEQRLRHTQEYADAIRQQAQDRIEANRVLESEARNLTLALSDSREKVGELSKELGGSRASLEASRVDLAAIQSQHEEEIRTLRFELGEAQDTVVESGALNNQLTSDLVDARTFKEELERMLGNAEEQSTQHNERLEKKIKKLARNQEDLEQKLNTKSEAITVLLAELAKKADSPDSIGDIELSSEDTNERMIERSSRPVGSEKQSPLDRTTRVLIGTVEGQVLRFPLFKDRLTIGRTNENDIQLKAAYISRKHAVIQTIGGKTRIIDWGSKNGVRVNAEKISEHFLQHGDSLIIGNARFRYEERKKRD